MFRTRKKLANHCSWVKLSRVVRLFTARNPTQLNQLSWVELSWVLRSEQDFSLWVVFKTALMVWKCIHGVPSYTSATTSGRGNLRSISSRTLLVPRVRTAASSEGWQSMDRPRGTVCRLHYEHLSCHRTPSYLHWTRTCSSRPPGTVETFYAIPTPNTNALTYLLTYSDRLRSIVWRMGQNTFSLPQLHDTF